MWIMITKQVPTNPFPLFMGFYWAVPWTDKKIAEAQAERQAYGDGLHSSAAALRARAVETVGCPLCLAEPGELCKTSSGQPLSKPHALRRGRYVPDGSELIDPSEESVPCPWGGREPNWNGAMRVTVSGEQVRVFPHEYTKLPAERMKSYILGDDESPPTHDLQPSSVAESDMLEDVLDGVRGVLYEEALVDGCTEAQAMHVALGNDLDIPDAELPPVGWYRPRWYVLETFLRTPDLDRVKRAYGYWGEEPEPDNQE